MKNPLKSTEKHVFFARSWRPASSAFGVWAPRDRGRWAAKELGPIRWEAQGGRIQGGRGFRFFFFFFSVLFFFCFSDFLVLFFFVFLLMFGCFLFVVCVFLVFSVLVL